MSNQPNKALVIFSGGQDSTTCLFLAIKEFGAENVEVITFQYGQRHAIELEKARWIAQDLKVKQTLLDTSVIKAITHNALMDPNAQISQKDDELPNTFVDGRNALFFALRRHLRQKPRHSCHLHRRVRNRFQRLSRLSRRVCQIHERDFKPGHGLPF